MSEPIEDQDSWVTESMYPTGTARGWRRVGCMATLIGAAVLLIAALAAAFAYGNDTDEADALCEDLQIQLTYLDATAADPSARDDVVRQMEEADCE